MQTTLPSSDPKKLQKGLAILEGMAITATSVRRNRSLSKANREFYEEQEECLSEVVRFARFHMTDIGAGI